MGKTSVPVWLGATAGIGIALVLLLNRFLPLLHGADQGLAAAASVLLVTGILIVSALFRVAGYALVGFILFFGGLQRYVISLGIREPNALIPDLMESDLRELSGFVDPILLGAFAAILVIAYLIVNVLAVAVPRQIAGKIEQNRRPTVSVFAFGVMTVALAGMAVPKPRIEESTERIIQASMWPLVPIAQSLRVFKGYWTGEKQFAHLIDSVPSTADLPSSMVAHDEGLAVVFVFGESVRADHWGLNGYARDTTPRLSARTGLINFSDALSFGTYTQVSAVGMMTPTTFAQPQPRAGSFVDLFVKYGFETAAFIASRPTSIQLRLISEIKRQERKRGLAMELMPGIGAFLEQGGHANQFLFVYTEGNHFPYNRGYSPEFSVFRPDDHGRTNLNGQIDKLVNAYDNSVRYTDYFLDSIIEKLQNRRAIVIYMADHGDALGDEGHFIRGGTMQSPYLRKVPFFIWASDAYVRSEPEKMQWLRRHANMKVAQEHLFSTILGLSGIRSEVADPGLDLSSPQARPREYEVADGAPVSSRWHAARK